MDSYVKERLQEWNLCHLIETFQEEGVDKESFMLLDDASIAALIPRIGFRVKFKKYHSELLESLGHSPVNNQPCPSQSPVRNDPATPAQIILESCQTRSSNSTFDIREILSNSGGSALISSLDRDGHLSLKDRCQMVRLLVSHLMGRFGENPTAEIKKEMALAITAQFPCLKSNEGYGYEVWYTPCRYRHPATGYLEERLRNVRKRLRKQPSQNSSSQTSFPLPESALSSTDIHTMLEWLKNNRGPHSQIMEPMGHAAPHRAAWIRSPGSETIEEINAEYPKLHDFPGMSLGNSSINNQSCPGQSSVRNDPVTPAQIILESCQTRSSNSFDIREILSNSGGSALISSLDRDRHLSLKERRQMVRLLVSHLMGRFGENPTAEIKKEMALAITAQFPCLKSNEGYGYEVWYTPCRYRHPATGYLEERLRNVRKRLRGQRQQSNPQPSQYSSSRPSFPLPESQLSSDVIQKMIEWLKNNRSPHSQVMEFMRHTAPHRAAWIRSLGTKTVEEINAEYPRLHDSPGMILQDFEVVFPDHADRLYEFWAPVFTDRILLFTKKEPKASDVLPENLEALPIDVRGEIALNCLPVILPSSPYRTNEKIVRPTYAEMKRSFIDIQPVGTDMVHYLDSETSPDPHVLVLGDKGNFSEVFVIFNGEAIEQETLVQAVDLCFKIFYVYAINYPKPSAPIWEFLQYAIFKIPGGVPSTHCCLLKNFVFNVTDHQ
ncbi:uncharacterized protein si:dkey-286j15.1 [Pimephales promelas]|uniref:uncharacterized protein si:dkey-286j15.1 n=1 Tax=Pimephales promelas TaxID=90988 RepID=UPI001955A967|nr:uncharacterized protein si:dkey-286j15.1 [Pimephales promelas]KAG1941532.1 hypothetical protein F2P79_015957 [Pimephales promelas]